MSYEVWNNMCGLPQRSKNDDIGERNAQELKDEWENSKGSHTKIEDVPVGRKILDQTQAQQLQRGLQGVHYKIKRNKNNNYKYFS